MVDVLLRGAGAKSAADIMGSDKVTPKADYKWGDKKVDLKDVKPGDVLQFKDHKIVIKTRTTTKKTYPDGHSVVEQGGPPDETLQRGHHSAVVLANDGNGKMTVAEQHVLDHSTNKETSAVRKNQLFTQGATTTFPTTTRFEGNVKIEETKTVTISVTGEISAYRPQKK